MDSVQQEYISENVRNRRRRRQADDSTEPDADLQDAQKFCVQSFFVIIDKLLASLVQRRQAYHQISEDFAFVKSLRENDAAQLTVDATRLVKKYTNDLEPDCENEFVTFSDFITHLKLDRDPQTLLKYLRKNPVVESTFANVSTALRLFLTLPVTVCEGERSFSKLSLIKNRFRSTMTQDRLNALSVMSIENDVTSSMTFDTIIERFSQTKSRKHSLV